MLTIWFHPLKRVYHFLFPVIDQNVGPKKNPFEKIVGVTLGEVSIWWAPLFCTHTQSRHCVFVLWSVGQLGGRKKKSWEQKRAASRLIN